MFPDVPNLPGVPPLPRAVGAVIDDIILLTVDIIGFLAGFSGSVWGIYQNGVPVLIADSFVSIDYRQDWSLSDYPTEKGGFESYNKVNTPFNVKVRFAQGGSQADRQSILDNIADIAATTELYDVVTPEQVYTSVNISGYNFRRTATNGVGLILLDVALQEVRVTASAEFSNTKDPSSASPVNDGTVTPQSLTPGAVTRGTDLPNISAPLNFQ